MSYTKAVQALVNDVRNRETVRSDLQGMHFGWRNPDEIVRIVAEALGVDISQDPDRHKSWEALWQTSYAETVQAYVDNVRATRGAGI